MYAGVSEERCSWCDRGVELDDGFRLAERPGERRAVFCRLEHVVPWAMSGPHWDAGTIEQPPGLEDAPERCARCDAELGDVSVLLVSHRGEHRVPDAFCSVEHLREWSAAGGRYS